MAIFLTLLTVGIISTLFYTPVPEDMVQKLEWAALGVPIALLLWQMIQLSHKGAEKHKQEESAPTQAQPSAAAVEQDPRKLQDAAVIQFLSRLQEKGRLIDFVMDDMTPYGDEQVGAAARIVHQGCQEVLGDFFKIAPLHDGAEEENITLAQGYDSASYRLVGSVPEQPPYTGVVLHRGWITHSVNLPRVSAADLLEDDAYVIAPAEVEIESAQSS
ncbi:MAG: DUF2760 domain-containing protein [Desulfuromonadaceae bacterium]|nr:DUF2760 domain-containing protein [Geobacteraceae bacterium]